MMNLILYERWKILHMKKQEAEKISAHCGGVCNLLGYSFPDNSYQPTLEDYLPYIKCNKWFHFLPKEIVLRSRSCVAPTTTSDRLFAELAQYRIDHDRN